MKKTGYILLGAGLSLLWFFCGCQKTYYAVWETFGKEKRHLLRDQVKKAGTEQEEASQQFEDTLSRIQAMYGFEGGDLEDMYEKLKDDYAECRNRADMVRNRVDNIEEIAADLFSEWDKEINEITNATFKNQSRNSLNTTKRRYDRLHAAMKKAEKSMEPVLQDLNDYVLFLKHNLNAQAIGALKSEADSIGIEVSSLLKDMNQSIKEADEFLKTLE